MPRASVSTQNFASGEHSPKLRGRYDVELYYSGCERLVNFISETQGPARFRTGTRFVAKTRYNQKAAIISFQYNDAQSYVLEFTNLGLRFFTDEGIVTEAASTVSAVTQANPAVVTDNAHGYSNGDEIILGNIAGMTELNGKTFKLAGVTTNTYQLNEQSVSAVTVDSSAFAAYTSGGASEKIYHLASPYPEAEIFNLKVAQSADTMYIVNKNYVPYKLVRSGATSWTLGTYTRTSDPFGSSGNYPSAVNIYDQRLYMAGTDNFPLSFWGSVASSYDDFTTGTGATDSFIFTIASRKSDRILALESNDKFLAVLATGGNKRVSGSDGDAITATNVSIKDIDFIGSDPATPVLKDNLIIYLQQGQRKLRSLEYNFESDGYLPENLNQIADHITSGGIVQMAYQENSPDIIWAIKTDGQLAGLTYNKKENIMGWHRHKTGANDKFTSISAIPRNSDYEQLWVCSQRIIGGSTNYFIEFFEDDPVFPEFIDYFTSPENKVSDTESFQYALNEIQKDYFHLDSGLTYNGSIQTVTMGLGALTGVSVTFTASSGLFAASDIGRQIWAKGKSGRAEIIGYTSATVVTCEILKDFTEGVSSDIAAGEYFFTAGTISGLDHLEGETISVVTDGSIHPDKTVLSGSITLDYQAGMVHAGISYTGLIVTNNVEGGGASGAAQTKVKNVFKIGIRFLNTLGTSFGTDIYNMEKIPFRSTASSTNRAPELFSGDKVFPVDDSWEREKRVVIKQDKPLPCTVQLLMAYLNTSED